MVKKLLKLFMKAMLQKTNQKDFRIVNVIERKGNKSYMLTEKVMIIHLTVGLIKMTLYKKE